MVEETAKGEDVCFRQSIYWGCAKKSRIEKVTVASAIGTNEQGNSPKNKTIIRAVSVQKVTKEKCHKKSSGNDSESECEKCEEQEWESEESLEEQGSESESIAIKNFVSVMM